MAALRGRSKKLEAEVEAGELLDQRSVTITVDRTPDFEENLLE